MHVQSKAYKQAKSPWKGRRLSPPIPRSTIIPAQFSSSD